MLPEDPGPPGEPGPGRLLSGTDSACVFIDPGIGIVGWFGGIMPCGAPVIGLPPGRGPRGGGPPIPPIIASVGGGGGGALS